jgi:hypothetical protein
MRRIGWLLAAVVATVGLALAQPALATSPGMQPCKAQDMQKTWSPGGSSNEARQCNGTLNQTSTNTPLATVGNSNVNGATGPWIGGGYENEQSNSTWIDQSQRANAAQVNAAYQSISTSPQHEDPSGWYSDGGGGSSNLENQAHQTNGDLTQTSTNTPLATVGNSNVNASPQASVWGSNYQSNEQSNSTSIDQSQHANAAQVNLAGQSIQQGSPSKDPSNSVDQSNGKLTQTSTNDPLATVANSNVNASPQASVWGSNHQYNEQSNSTSIDQSQHTNAAQVNLAGQSIRQN